MRLSHTIVSLLSLATVAAAQQRIELINDPVADGIFVEDGVAGYQYIFDLYGNSGGFGAYAIGGDQGPLGEDGTFNAMDSAWWRDPTGDLVWAGIYQAWYSSSVGNSCGLFGCEPNGLNDPAGYANPPINSWLLDGVHHDGSSGIGPLFNAGTPIPWVRDNTWHVPTEYGSTSEYFFPGPDFGVTTTPDEGAAWGTVTGIFSGGPLGLQMTARIVSPYEPGDINWYIDCPCSGQTTGPSGAAIVHLDADTSTISLATGGSQNLDLYSPASGFAGHLYLMLGSSTGTSPGTPVTGSITLPLNIDSYTLIVAAGNPPFSGSNGVVDSGGRASMSINVPAGLTAPALIGLTLNHAVVTLDLLAAGGPSFSGASNAVSLDFTN